jgi:rod shape determining protein RodA
VPAATPPLVRRAPRPRWSLPGAGTTPWREADWVLLAAVALLGVIGAFTVYSATRTRLERLGIDEYYYVQRQVVYLVIVTGVLALVMWVGHDAIRERGLWWYGLAGVLLVFVLVSGAVTRGARLAFDLGAVSVQPAEFMKFAVLVLVAAYAADSFSARIDYHQFTVSLWLLVLPVALILLQPDLGSATVLAAGVLGVLLVAGARRRYFLGYIALAALTAALTVVGGVANDYQLGRFRAWFNQDSTAPELQRIVLQVRFAKRAVSSGGILGKGYLDGPLTNGAYVPVQFSDFPFSAIAEQFGMVGGIVVIGLFATILWRLWSIAEAARQPFDRLFVVGVFTMLLWQVFQNLGMTMGIMPVSGLPLPFVSYGGSHLVGSALLVGMCESIHMRRKS